MKNKTTSILLFGKQFTHFTKYLLIAGLLFTQAVSFAQQERGGEEVEIKTFPQEPYPYEDEPVIPFVSPSPQSDWNIKRQTGRLVGVEPVMFFDDDFIFDMKGITRTMHPVEKHGMMSRPSIKTLDNSEDLYGELSIRRLLRAPDEKGFLAICSGGYKDKMLITLFHTIDGHSFEPVYVNQVAPGLIWDDLPKEKLPEENNVLAFFPDTEPQFNLPAYSSYFEFPAGKDFRYGAFFINKYPRPRQTYLFGSTDGVNWQYIEHNQLTVKDEANAPTYDPFKDRYLAYLRHWDPHEKPSTSWRKVLLSESYEKDGELYFTNQFKPQALVLESDESDPAGADIYHMPVFSYASKYVGTPTIYNRRQSLIQTDLLETITVELAFSHEGYEWQRINQGKQFLPQGRGRAWDSGMTFMGRPAIVNNRLLFHYSGTNRRHDESGRPPAARDDLVSGIGSASLRIDGFVSLDAGDEGGMFVTVPFFPQGKHLYLNADARGGEIRVEVLQDGHRVELKKGEAGEESLGLFRMEKCIPILGDSIAHLVKWEHGENFIDNFPEGWNDELLYVTRRKHFTERAIHLKIYLKNAKLYSFWFADELMPVEAGRLLPVSGK